MKKLLLTLICAFTLVGNASAGIMWTCEELKEAIEEAQKSYDTAKSQYDALNMSDVLYKGKAEKIKQLKTEMDNQKQNLEFYKKDYTEQNCQ